jgi:hypothetical protein
MRNEDSIQTEMKNILKFQKVLINGKNFYLNVTNESLIEQSLISLLQHLPKTHPFSLMSNQLVLPWNKRPDFGSDLKDFQCRRMSKELRQLVGGKRNVRADLVEIKTVLNTKTLFSEIFPFNKIEEPELYVSPHYNQDDFTKQDVKTNNYKMYTAAYIEYAKQNNYKLKQLTYHFVAPQVTKETYEAAFVLNHAYNNTNGVYINIQIYTYQVFFQKLLDLISKDKWFVQNCIPANCINKHDVMLLVEDKKAIII